MDKYTIGTFDVSTNNLVIRDMTSEEVEQLKKEAAEEVARQAEREANLEFKATARQAVLDRLGLTPEEAQLILGGSN
jgi:hypothetical protein